MRDAVTGWRSGPAPRNLGFEQVATMPTNALTAAKALAHRSDLAHAWRQPDRSLNQFTNTALTAA